MSSTAIREGSITAEKSTNYGVVRLRLLEHIYQNLYTQSPLYSSPQHRILRYRTIASVEAVSAGSLRLRCQNATALYEKCYEPVDELRHTGCSSHSCTFSQKRRVVARASVWFKKTIAYALKRPWWILTSLASGCRAAMRRHMAWLSLSTRYSKILTCIRKLSDSLPSTLRHLTKQQQRLRLTSS